VLIAFPCPLDAAAKQTLRQAVSVADEHCFGLSIRLALDRAGQPVFFVETLPVPDRRDDCGPRSGSADEPAPPS
jgi:hypothetical protein